MEGGSVCGGADVGGGFQPALSVSQHPAPQRGPAARARALPADAGASAGAVAPRGVMGGGGAWDIQQAIHPRVCSAQRGRREDLVR